MSPTAKPASGATDRLVPKRIPGARGWPSQSGSWARRPRWSKQSTGWVVGDDWFELGSRLGGWPAHLGQTTAADRRSNGQAMKSPSGGSGGWGKRTSGKPGDVWVGGANQPGVGLWPTASSKQGGAGGLALAGRTLHRVGAISLGERGLASPRWGSGAWVVCPRKLRGVESSYIKRLFSRGVKCSRLRRSE